jgi:hypothetical protein
MLKLPTVVQVVTFLTCIPEVHCLNLGQDLDYPEISVVFLFLQATSENQATTVSFQTVYSLILLKSDPHSFSY